MEHDSILYMSIGASTFQHSPHLTSSWGQSWDKHDIYTYTSCSVFGSPTVKWAWRECHRQSLMIVYPLTKFVADMVYIPIDYVPSRTLSRVAVKKDLRSEVISNQRSLQKYGMEPGDSVVLFNGIVLQTESTDTFRWATIRAGINVETICILAHEWKKRQHSLSLIQFEYVKGIYSISLHLSLFRCSLHLSTLQISMLPKYRCPPKWGCQWFCIFCMHVSVRGDKQTILNALTKVEVWNSNILYLAAPIPIFPKFRCPPKWGCQQFCIFCMHVSVRGDKQTILNALTKVEVWNSNILAAPFPSCTNFTVPPNEDVNDFVCTLV